MRGARHNIAPSPLSKNSLVNISVDSIGSNIAQLDGQDITNIVQIDGNETELSSDVDCDDVMSEVSADDTNYETDDELDPCLSQANLFPVPGQIPIPGVPLKFDVNMNDDVTSFLPLCMMMNARSVYNKCNNRHEMLNQISPSCVILSETWE